jgi:hypothetical protein
VRCNRGFKQLQVHRERSNRSPSHIPLTGCAGYSSFSVLIGISLGAISKELQSGNGCYAFNASFPRNSQDCSTVAYDLSLSAAVRTIPRSHSCRGSVLTRGCHTIRMWKPRNSDGARTMRK